MSYTHNSSINALIGQLAIFRHTAVLEYFVTQKKVRNPGAMVTAVTRLWTGQSGVRILGSVRDFSLLQNIQTGSGTHPASR
jgi:hypothetical protein